ncbi:hypothetical protein GUJ93_ZPchr0458g22810 [Zizania palustris]|uniref:NAD-dependent epimerase/dehydratase domain-containing protein n=1 Tax=Zizania palustris TaxID=103762 RepID=A0A8J5VDW8_ZIZPA|nr:hypothetical protein GUJ93_ZPchr0458g22810 [Zizania palustris]
MSRSVARSRSLPPFLRLCSKVRDDGYWIGRLDHKDWLSPNEVLKIFANIRDPCLITSAFKKACGRRDYKPNEVLYSLMVDRLASCNKFRDVEELLATARDENFCFSDDFFYRLIKMYGNVANHPQKAMLTLYAMPRYNCWPSTKTFNYVLHMLVCKRQYEAAHEVYLSAVRLGVQLDTCSFNVLVKGLCQFGKFDDAISLLHEMPKQECLPNLHTYSTLMYYCGKHGQVDKAFELYERMKAEDIAADTIVYNILISGLCRERRITEAFDLLKSMVPQGCYPNSGTYQVLLDGLLSSGKFVEAKGLAIMMSQEGMDFGDYRRKPNVVGRFAVAAALTVMCIIVLKQSPGFSSTSVFSRHEIGVTHVLVTGGAGYIGSHATLRLLRDNYRVTIVDNLSRGNMGAVRVLQRLFPEPGRLQFIYADLGDAKAVNKIFSDNAFDAVMHFAAVAYVGESTMEPLRYYHNITSNTLTVLEAMAAHNVKTLIYSSTCATYGEPDKMPITEATPQNPINPYGKAKKMAEDIILDFSKSSKMAVMILRYFNVIGSDPEGRLGEAPRPELREHGRISGACFDAALGVIPGLKVRGTDYPTADGTCIRDYIDVTDLVDAHVKALDKAQSGKVGIYNVGTGHGRSVKEFVEACKKATGGSIDVQFLARRPGDYAEVYSDPSKIRDELNWTARHTDLRESLATAWKWQKTHPNGYGLA